MYLRFGWVVGHGGLIGAVLVMLLVRSSSQFEGASLLFDDE